jgi:hypothetical protein
MSGAPRANSRGAPSKPTTSSLLRVGRRPGDGERVRRRRSVETCRDVVRRHRDDVVACRRDVARSVVGLARTGEPAGVVERRIRETPELGAEHDLHVVTIRSRHISADVGIRLVDVHLLRLRDVLDGRGGWLGRLLRGRLARRRGHNDDRVLAMNLCLGLDVGLVDELAIEAHRRTALRLHEHPQRHLLSETCGAGCPGARVVRARSPDLSDQVDANHQASETAHHDDPAVGDDVVLRPLESERSSRTAPCGRCTRTRGGCPRTRTERRWRCGPSSSSPAHPCRRRSIGSRRASWPCGPSSSTDRWP